MDCQLKWRTKATHCRRRPEVI